MTVYSNLRLGNLCRATDFNNEGARSMEWKEWSSVAFKQREMLPKQSGIYVIVDNTEEVWYVGRAMNINSRWRGHHRYQQINRNDKKRSHRIYWKAFAIEELPQQEQLYIDVFKPHLNYTSVKKYPRKSVQPNEELGRLFRVINKKTSLFPNARSMVLGFYTEIDETEQGELQEYTCVVVTVSVNDHDGTILKSAAKSITRKGRNLKGCWNIYKNGCGCNDTGIRVAQIPVFIVGDIVYEFVPHPTLVDLLANDTSNIHHLKIAEQSVLALKDPTSSDLLTPFNPTYRRFLLTGEDYIQYRWADLQAASLIFPDL